MTATAQIRQYDDTLYLISLPVSIPGFEGFIGAWVHTADPVVIVDVGPAASIPHLLSALSDLGVTHLDMILLTHIHIDHAGGIGALAVQFPSAPVVCHPKGLSHLADPEKLWQGSLKTLGKIADAYGPIAPVEMKQLLGADRLDHEGVVAIETPGHAAHHYSFQIGDTLFAGEACGVNLPLDEGVYLRPATPPRFFLETSLHSLEQLMASNPRRLCYGHVGQRTNAMELMVAHRDQLLRWKEMIQPYLPAAGQDYAEACRSCLNLLVDNDPLLSGYAGLPPVVQERERGFLSNSIMGYLGYLETLGHT